MTVKIIPITPEYREGWEKTFKAKAADIGIRNSIPCCICDQEGTVNNPVYAFQCLQLAGIMVPLCLADIKQLKHD